MQGAAITSAVNLLSAAAQGHVAQVTPKNITCDI
jgi:hypothetical protein